MQATYKSGGAPRNPDGNGPLNLDRPAIVTLKIAPEKVARFHRHGADLVLVLDDGREMMVQGFFTTYPDGGRNDLVLEDEAGVHWWGQYHSPWSEFHFAEIAWEGAVPWLPFDPTTGLLAGIGALGLAAAAAGGSGSSGGHGPVTAFEPPNAAPETPSYRQATLEDRAVKGRVSGHDTDGDPLTYAVGTPPSHGSLVLEPDGSYTYTPDPDYQGLDRFTVIVDDGRGGTATSTIDIDVTPVDDPVVAGDDSLTVAEDTPLPLDLLANDEAPDGGLKITAIAGVALTPGMAQSIVITTDGTPGGAVVGTVRIDADGTITLVPAPNYHGPIDFDYVVEDGDGDTDTASIHVDVMPVNDPPTAADDQHTLAEDTSVSGQVTGDDVDGDPLAYSAGRPPAHGSVAVEPDGRYTYTPHPDYHGPDSFTVLVADGQGGTATSTITLDVTPADDPAVAADDTVTTAEDTPVVLDLLANDSAPDGGLRVTTIAGLPLTPGIAQSIVITADGTAEGTVIGSIRIDADGTITLVPASDYHGPITFDYVVADAEGDTDTASVHVDVTPVDDAPVPRGTIAGQNGHDAQSVDLPTAGAFTDVDGDTLTYTASGLPQGLTIDPDSGAITGTIDRSASQGGSGGVYDITITATDSDGRSARQQFTWAVANPAPQAGDDPVTATEDTVVGGNVLTGAGADDPAAAADTDQDGDPLTLTQFVVNGTTYPAGETATIAGVGTLRMNGDGSYVFTPVTDWHGTVPPVSYTAGDGEGGTDTAQLAITVTAVNDAPVIDGDAQSGTVTEAGHDDDGKAAPGTPSASGIVTATDVDNDLADLVWSIVGTPDATYGSFAIDPATGEWTYTLDNTLSATQALNKGDAVPLSFTVQVGDGSGGTAQQTVDITINGSNDAPAAVADTVSVKEAGVRNGGNAAAAGNPTATGNVLTNDSDVDDAEKATLTVSGIRFGDTEDAVAGTVGVPLTGTYGSLKLDASGHYDYALDNDRPATQALAQGQSGTEVFSYTVTDVNGASVTSTLTITVQGTNDQPVITSDAAAAQGTVTEAGSADATGVPTASGTLTTSDVDTGATLTWSIAQTNGSYGTIGIGAGGRWTYTLDNDRAATQALNDGDERTDSFTIRVTDQFGAFREETVTIDVHGANDNLTGTGSATVTLSEDPTGGVAGNAHTGTLQSYVTDIDDTLVLVKFSVGGTEYTPGQTATIPDVGMLSIASNGDYIFTPLPNYSGAVPPVSYTMQEDKTDGLTVTQTLTFAITPVADAPTMPAGKIVTTGEDTRAALGLGLPAVADDTDRNGTGVGDEPERLGAISLTLAGAGAAGATLSTTVAGSPVSLAPVGGAVRIVITETSGSDVPSSRHVTDPALVPAKNETGGVYYLTEAEYAAIAVTPGTHDHRNVRVTVAATSYEVDAGGAKLAAVTGATATQVVTVDVLAVTDTPQLTLVEPADAAAVAAIGAVSLTTTPAVDGGANARITAAINEDATLDLTNVLQESFPDIDRSERVGYQVTGLPPGTVVHVDGTAYTAGAGGVATIPVGDLTASNTFNPTFTITPPANYANTAPIEATLTLRARDVDSDSPTAAVGQPAAPQIESVSVDLTLRVYALPDDVTLPAPAPAPEDTPIAILGRLALADTDGSESITQVRITGLPTAGGTWTLLDHEGNDVTIPGGGTAAGGGLVLTIVTAPSAEPGEYTLDQVKAFTLRPPAHSSLDGSITVYVTTTETAAGIQSGEAHSREWTHTLPIVVQPVAERADSDSDHDGHDDVSLGGHAYNGPIGREDEWFALGTNPSGAAPGENVALRTDWSNEDGKEFDYAVLTPTLTSADPGDSVLGTQFRYHDGNGWTTLTYTGQPLWVPEPYLESLQIKAPENVSGTLAVGLQAATVDYDDDANVTARPADPPRASIPGIVDVRISGAAQLTGIEIAPVADAVTLALNGRAVGREDSEIPLLMRATSPDPSETFDLTITGIPDGATLTYGGHSVSATGGAATITNFDHAKVTTITPPPNSNAPFTLQVSAQSVDGSNRSAPTPVRSIVVAVEGVADAAVVQPAATTPVFTEAALDSGTRVTLASLIDSVASADDDGSETLSLRITGLAEGFTIAGAPLVSAGNDGDTRVWAAPASAMASVEIRPPANYSGPVHFQVAGVTTESDGDSHTGAPTTVGFTVTPSPEATVTDSLVLTEDGQSPLNLRIIHQNGDTDETLGRVFISVPSAAEATTFTLFLGDTPLVNAGAAIESIGGIDHYVIPADQVQYLHARGADHLDGPLGGFDFHYEITDSGSGGQAADAPVTIRSPGRFTLSAAPVTDPVSVSVTGISGPPAATTIEDRTPGDDADPDTVTVTAPGTMVTVTLRVQSNDHDGSEQLIRVLVDGVPEDVSIVDGAQVGPATWLVVYQGAQALAIDQSGGIEVPIQFMVGSDTARGPGTPITMTVQALDRGNEAEPGTAVMEDSVTWNLITDMIEGEGSKPPIIVIWKYTGAPAAEDTVFALSDMLEAEIIVQSPNVPNVFTLSLTGVPEDTVIDGMARTTVNGVPTWTASVTVAANGDAQAALDGLLGRIEVTPPQDSNDNNAAAFGFDARLMAFAAGGPSEHKDVTAAIPVAPVSDEALITVDAGNVDETSGRIDVSIDVGMPRDGSEHGRIIDGRLFVQVDASAGNGGGTLSLPDGTELTAEAVSSLGPDGVPDGNYFVLEVGTSGGSVDLVYTPAPDQPLQPGTVTFQAWVRTSEAGDVAPVTGVPRTVTGSEAGTAVIAIANNGVTVHSTVLEGVETAAAAADQAIALTGLQVTLNDDDSEAIDAIMLGGVPVGFLVYLGDDAASARLANNAGHDTASDGSPTNTWVLSAGGNLPAYVAILPPAHWSGTLDGLQLVVESGEATLPTSRIDLVDLADVVVSPVADGVTIEPTAAFGQEGGIISLNVNAAMRDASTATASVPDASQETTTLRFTGLGAHAAFYTDDTLIAPGSEALDYDTANDTYTLAGLSQDDLDKLGFVQAAPALNDQDGDASGTQIQVTAWTVESGGGSPSAQETGTLDLQITALPASGHADTFLWGGAGKPLIDGLGGDDTVKLRLGEDVTGADLGAGLRSIETLDLLAAGANRVTGLTLQDVLDLTDGRNTLRILGSGQDSVSLAPGAGEWTRGTSDGVFTTYSGQLGAHTITVLVEDALTQVSITA